jgi:hypothetical protein
MTIVGRGLWVAVALVLFAVPVGCKQILGLDERIGLELDDGGSDASALSTPAVGECGSLRHPSQSCAACMDRNCCGEATACRNDIACDSSFECMSSCGNDGACRAQCAAFYTQPASLVSVGSCRETNCAAECGLSCGGFAYRVPGCDSCVRSTCCSLAAACAKNEACVNLDLCRTNCLAGSMACPPQCDREHPDGIADYAPWFDCTQNACGASCQPGRVWQCLDSAIRWPKPKGNLSEITFSMNIIDLVTEKPFVGARIKACGKLDQFCTSPLDEDTTDAAGLVALTVPVGNVGFDGFVDMSGGDSGGGDALYPSIWYPLPYIVSSGSRGRIQFVSQSSFTLLAGITQITPDPTRGHFAANAQDCTFSSAGGVSISASTTDTASATFYFVGGIPNASATETDPHSGIGGFVNLPARLTLVTATGADGRRIAAPNFFIRPGTMTTTSLPPM